MSDFVDLPLQKKLNRRNIVTRLEKVENKTGPQPGARINSLSELSQNLGEQVAGIFRCIDPTTGVMRGYLAAVPQAEAPGYHLAFFDNSGNLQFGVSADNGSAIAAGGLMSFGDDGISFYSQGVAMRFGASQAATIDGERQGWFVGGLDTYMDGGQGARFGLHSFARNGAAIINEGFETDLSGWTLVGSPVQSTLYKTGGIYSCRVDKTNYIKKSIAVTAGNYYLVTLKVRKTSATGYFAIMDQPLLYLPANAWTLVLFLYRAASTTNVDFSFGGWTSGDATDPIYIDDIYAYPCDSAFSFTGDTVDGGGTYQIMSADSISLEIGRNDGGGSIDLNSKLRDADTHIYGTSTDPVLKVDAGLNKAYYNGAEIGWALIEDKILSGGDAASFDFQSIPATYKNLKIEFTGRSDRAGSGSDSAVIKINNDAGNNYVGLIQWGAGQTEQATAGAPLIFAYTTAATSPANWFSNSEITLFDYANTTTFKNFQSRGMQAITNSAGNYFIYDGMGMWLSTNAISRVTLYPGVGSNFKQYSRATLYGLR